MSAILLDTSAYSAFMQGNESIKQRVQESEEIVITPIVLGELKSGFLRGSRNRKNLQDLDIFLQSPRVRIVPIDDETSYRYAVILNGLRMAGTPVPTNDIWIAATAMQYGLRVVSCDKHFGCIPQVVSEIEK